MKRPRKKPAWMLEARICSKPGCNGSYYPTRQAQEYCTQECRRDAAYGRERFESGTKGPRRRCIKASDNRGGTPILGSFRNGHISSIETVGYKHPFGCLKPYVWPEETRNPLHGSNPDGSTPGAIQGDYPLEYYADGLPKLPACLDRRKPKLAEAA
jgi:hypothetical protein